MENIRKTIGWKFLELVGVTILCYCFGRAVVTSSNIMTINIDYNQTGTVVINNASNMNYEGLVIEIHNAYDEEIYYELVEKEKLLVAQEGKHIKDIVGEASLVNDEKLYWKYILDLEQVIDESGKYNIVVIVNQKEKNVVLENDFVKEGKEYIFAKDNMKKNY